MSPAKVDESRPRGWIVPVGGAEDKEQDAVILRRFLAVSGGSAARVVIIPTASRLPETGPRYERIFRHLEAAFPFCKRAFWKYEAVSRTCEAASPFHEAASPPREGAYRKCEGASPPSEGAYRKCEGAFFFTKGLPF